jgi:energy-converting hydrogenase Eha subunit B
VKYQNDGNFMEIMCDKFGGIWCHSRLAVPENCPKTAQKVGTVGEAGPLFCTFLVYLNNVVCLALKNFLVGSYVLVCRETNVIIRFRERSQLNGTISEKFRCLCLLLFVEF